MEGSVRKRKKREDVVCIVKEQLWFLVPCFLPQCIQCTAGLKGEMEFRMGRVQRILVQWQ